jgi:hypothetical protein
MPLAEFAVEGAGEEVCEEADAPGMDQRLALQQAQGDRSETGFQSPDCIG